MLLKYTSSAALLSFALLTPAVAQVTTPPTSQGIAGQAAQTSSANDDDFVKQAANSGMFEVQSSQLAENKVQNSSVRTFAQHMVSDHTEANGKLKAAAGSHAVPTTLDSEHAGMLQQLQQASGPDFERRYVQMQFEGHQKAVGLFDGYSQSGDDEKLKSFATETLPKLREHLQQITQIRAQAGSDRSASAARGQPSGSTGFVTELRLGDMRVSKLSGVDVYNTENEKIGDISDVILDSNGAASGVVVSVGGFLGLGQHHVAVPFSALRWNDAEAGANRGSGSGTPSGGTPSRVVLPNASKDQLKAAPQFKL